MTEPGEWDMDCDDDFEPDNLHAKITKVMDSHEYELAEEEKRRNWLTEPMILRAISLGQWTLISNRILHEGVGLQSRALLKKNSHHLPKVVLMALKKSGYCWP